MSSKVRLTIVYYSTYGTNYRMATVAEEAAEATGAEVRLRKVPETAPAEVVEKVEGWRNTRQQMIVVPEVTPEDMEWANAYLFSAPTRYGVSASQLRAFIDTLGPLWSQGKLANKAASAMSSAMNPHGGQETTLISLYTTMMHWGCILVPPGYTDPILYQAGGNPYGVTVTANGEAIPEPTLEAIRYQVRRLVEFAGKIAS